MKVLHIEASPMKGESFSSRAAEALISTLRETHPDWEVERLDLWDEEIPYFDGRAASGKYKVMRGLPHSPEEAEAWEKVKGEIERFSSADLVIISSPMWNFGIPFRLKQYLDVVIQPGLTFSFTPGEGYRGLLGGKKAVLILARGGEYREGSGAESYDFQKPYLELALGFMGIEVVDSILIEPTMGKGREEAERALQKAVKKAGEVARRL